MYQMSEFDPCTPRRVQQKRETVKLLKLCFKLSFIFCKFQIKFLLKF